MRQRLQLGQDELLSHRPSRQLSQTVLWGCWMVKFTVTVAPVLTGLGLTLSMVTVGRLGFETVTENMA